MRPQGCAPRGEPIVCEAQRSTGRRLDLDAESKSRFLRLCLRSVIIRCTVSGVMLAPFFISGHVALVEGAAELLVPTPFLQDRIDPLTQPPLLFRPALQQSRMSGAVFALTLVSPPDLVTVSGWFHIIWNGVPRYGLVDDEGEWTDLLIEERVLRDTGGPRVLNRKWVRITGRRPGTGARTIQVETINPEERDAR